MPAPSKNNISHAKMHALPKNIYTPLKQMQAPPKMFMSQVKIIIQRNSFGEGKKVIFWGSFQEWRVCRSISILSTRKSLWIKDTQAKMIFGENATVESQSKREHKRRIFNYKLRSLFQVTLLLKRVGKSNAGNKYVCRRYWPSNTFLRNLEPKGNLDTVLMESDLPF